MLGLHVAGVRLVDRRAWLRPLTVVDGVGDHDDADGLPELVEVGDRVELHDVRTTGLHHRPIARQGGRPRELLQTQLHGPRPRRSPHPRVVVLGRGRGACCRGGSATATVGESASCDVLWSMRQTRPSRVRRSTRPLEFEVAPAAPTMRWITSIEPGSDGARRCKGVAFGLALLAAAVSQSVVAGNAARPQLRDNTVSNLCADPPALLQPLVHTAIRPGSVRFRASTGIERNGASAWGDSAG
jgi:hypothetical protein